MATKQRSVNVPLDLNQLVKAHEARAGATFNRQVVAALLQFTLSKPSGPSKFWTEQAVLLQNGETTIADILKRCESEARWMHGILEHAESVVEGLRDRVPQLDDEGKAAVQECLKNLIGLISGTRLDIAGWMQVLEHSGDDVLAALIAYWSEPVRQAAYWDGQIAPDIDKLKGPLLRNHGRPPKGWKPPTE